MDKAQAIAWLLLEGYEAWRPAHVDPNWEGVSKDGVLVYLMDKGATVAKLDAGWPTQAENRPAFEGLGVSMDALYRPELLVKALTYEP